jgi:hypothetical protein
MLVTPAAPETAAPEPETLAMVVVEAVMEVMAAVAETVAEWCLHRVIIYLFLQNVLL